MKPIYRTMAAFGLTLAVSAFISPAYAQLDALCREDANEYRELLDLKQRATPEQVAQAYADVFVTKGADREAQAVWRRMNGGSDASLEEALKTHLERYHSKKSESERAELAADITTQIEQMSLIHELVLTFESAEITGDFAAATLEESWQSRDWSAPHPIEHYVSMVRKRAREYEAAGGGAELAAVRASVDARNAVDRDRGVAAAAIHDSGDPCYAREVANFEMWLRHAALKRAGHAMTEMQIAELGRDVSLLTYYTHNRFGPRDYSYDRLRAWREAARSAAR